MWMEYTEKVVWCKFIKKCPRNTGPKLQYFGHFFWRTGHEFNEVVTYANGHDRTRKCINNNKI